MLVSQRFSTSGRVQGRAALDAVGPAKVFGHRVLAVGLLDLRVGEAAVPVEHLADLVVLGLHPLRGAGARLLVEGALLPAGLFLLLKGYLDGLLLSHSSLDAMAGAQKAMSR